MVGLKIQLLCFMPALKVKPLSKCPLVLFSMEKGWLIARDASMVGIMQHRWKIAAKNSFLASSWEKVDFPYFLFLY